MTELEELEEVFFYSPPPTFHTQKELECSFLLHPYPDTRDLFAAVFHQR